MDHENGLLRYPTLPSVRQGTYRAVLLLSVLCSSSVLPITGSVYAQVSIVSPPVIVDIPPGPNRLAQLDDPLNLDRAIFSVSTFDDALGRAFYFSAQNNRIMVNFLKQDGTWHFPLQSVVAIEMPDPSTIALGVVFSSNTADYRNACNGMHYKRMMYFIYQPHVPSSGAGFPCVAFSNDGIDWSAPKLRVTSNEKQIIGCNSINHETLKLEAIAGLIHGVPIYLAGLEGDIAVLDQYALADRTLTYLFETSISSPHTVSLHGEFPTDGMFTPNLQDIPPSKYMFNLDFSYDAASDKVLLARVTPFPYEYLPNVPPPYLGGTVPCSGVCPTGLFTFPMRGQIYSKFVNGDFPGVLTGPWQLELDIGGVTGWSIERVFGCWRYPANDPSQENIGVDLDSLNLHKTKSGSVAREADGSITLYMGAFEDRQLSCDQKANANQTFVDGDLRSASFDIED